MFLNFFFEFFLVEKMEEKFIFFVCVKNFVRSQMVEVFFNYFNDDLRFRVMSVGMEFVEEIDLFVRKVMEEIGIFFEGQYLKFYIEEMVDKVYIVIMMGCFDKCFYVLFEKMWDWGFDDFYGQLIEKYCEVRDEIKCCVLKLIDDLKVGKSREEIIGKKLVFLILISVK